jgi:hypothetical protein
MRITQLRLENFKSFKEPTTIDFAPVTLLFGPNSAGKSTVVQALSYMSRGFASLSTKEFENLFNAKLNEKADFFSIGVSVDIGEFDIIESRSAQELNGYLTIFEESNDNEYTDFSAMTSAINSVGVTIYYRSGKACSGFEIWLNTEKFMSVKPVKSDKKNTTSESSVKPWQITEINSSHSLFEDNDFRSVWDLVTDPFNECLDSGDFQIGIQGRTPSANMTIQVPSTSWSENASSSLIRKIIESFLGLLLNSAFEVVEEELDATSHLGPLRIVPEDQDSFENANDYDGSRFWRDLSRREDFGEQYLGEVSECFEDKISSGYSVKRMHIRTIYENSDNAETMLDMEFSSAQLMKYNHHINGENVNFYELDKDGVPLNITEEVDAELVDYLKEYKLKAYDDAQLTGQAGIFFVNEEGFFSPKNVGVGLSQVLPVVVGSRENSIRFFCVEQPELHIHPRMQTGLADIFIDASGTERFSDPRDPSAEDYENSKPVNFNNLEFESATKYVPAKGVKVTDAHKTFLIETHSEHLVLRLLKRIRQGVISTDYASVLYIQKQENGSQVTKLRIDDEGDFIDEWPGGFFDERDEELF